MLDTTKIVLPKLIENKEGLMLNLGSYVGTLTPPLLSAYAGSKAFINSWSTSLNGEYKSKGLTVLALTPMYVQVRLFLTKE
jgi:17beta-estradiol 17-dehydrogenase / very-long-chain 3-oxoacyl-CoA reductase